MTSGRVTAQDTVERALAADKPGGDLIVIADEHSSVNLRWAGNTLTTNGVTSTRTLTVIAIDRRGSASGGAASGGTGVGIVSRSGARPDQVEEIVAEARKAAADAPPAADAAELEPPATGRSGSRSWEADAAGTEVGVLRGFASQLGETLRAAEAAGRKLYGFAEHEVTSTFLGTSSGLRLRHDQPTGRLELNAKSADLTRSAWAGATTRDFSDVDPVALDASLAQRLAWQARRAELPAGRYETLLPPTAVADLMINFYWAAGAREAAEGRSAFAVAGGGTRVGERLSAQPVSLFSDPDYPGLECAPFVIAHSSSDDSSVFDNGMASGRATWLSDGVLSGLYSSRHSAKLAGLPVTPAVDNLVLNGGTEHGRDAGSLEAMIASTRRGLLLTCLWYIRVVDPQTLLLTGLTRDGVYLIEDGEVTGAVNNFRFNETPVGMLSRLAEAGATERSTLPREWSDYFTRCAMPPLRIEGFNMSSVSQASLSGGWKPIPQTPRDERPSGALLLPPCAWSLLPRSGQSGATRGRPSKPVASGPGYAGGVMRVGHHGRGQQVHLVTQARRSLSEDIAYRQRRYLIMMGIRAVCFAVAVVVFVNHGGWLTAIPAVGAIVIPYFAVIFANGGREPDNTRGFLEHRMNLPAHRDTPRDGQDDRP